MGKRGCWKFQDKVANTRIMKNEKVNLPWTVNMKCPKFT